MELKEKVKELHDKYFIPYTKMARLIGIRPKTLYQWKAGRTTIAKSKLDYLNNFIDNFYKQVNENKYLNYYVSIRDKEQAYIEQELLHYSRHIID